MGAAAVDRLATVIHRLMVKSPMVRLATVEEAVAIGAWLCSDTCNSTVARYPISRRATY
jgi:hypothetical protein